VYLLILRDMWQSSFVARANQEYETNFLIKERLLHELDSHDHCLGATDGDVAVLRPSNVAETLARLGMEMCCTIKRMLCNGYYQTPP